MSHRHHFKRESGGRRPEEEEEECVGRWGRGGGQGVEGLSLNLYRHSRAEQGGERGVRQTSASLFDWLSSHLLVNAQQFTRSLTHHRGWRIRATVDACPLVYMELLRVIL